MAKTNVTVTLVGQDGNIYNLVAIVQRELKKAGYKEEAKQMWEEIQLTKSYTEALAKIYEYVEEV